MINRFSKMRDSLFTKIILTVTALSFMSLFGVSGYIDTANSNKAVIKVDDLETSQSQFSYMLQREILRLKAYGNIDFNDDGSQKSQVTDKLLKIKLDEMIFDNTLKKYNIDIRESSVTQILKMASQFQTNGQFDSEKYRAYKDLTGKSDEEMLSDVKRNFLRKFVLDYPVAYVNVPKIQLAQMAKVAGQRRTFRYVKIENAAANITRKAPREELDQYYDDLIEDLIIPESRDLTVMYVPQEQLTASIVIPQEEIDAYYKEHIDEYEQGEQRAVLQMAFDTKDKADAAYEKLNNGEDFIAIAEENGQKAEEINLGFVSANDVSEELSKVIFATDAGKYSEPVKIADSWQILKVNDVKTASTSSLNEIFAKIADELRQNKEYDNNYNVISDIDDKVGAGKSLQEIAASYNVPLLKVKGINEDGKAEFVDDKLKDIINDKEFMEVTFSYNENEIGRTIETNDGIAVIMVDKIHDIHKKPREESDEILLKAWEDNERAAITQELVDNIEHDLEAGDDLTLVASRYNLQLVNSRPVTRNETIDKISFVEMKKLFSAPKDNPQIIKLGDDYIVAETTNIYDDSDSINSDKKEEIKNTLYKESVDEMADALLQDFADDYKILINYRRIGSEE